VVIIGFCPICDSISVSAVHAPTITTAFVFYALALNHSKYFLYESVSFRESYHSRVHTVAKQQYNVIYACSVGMI
jgi:hypothetical protein